MKQRQIKFFFKRQARFIIERSAGDPEGPIAYFQGREPRDEEVLGLLAVSGPLAGDSPFAYWFPSPLEALAALSPSSRLEVCEIFRQQLRCHCGAAARPARRDVATAAHS